jgi:hypothetical protein
MRWRAFPGTWRAGALQRVNAPEVRVQTVTPMPRFTTRVTICLVYMLDVTRTASLATRVTLTMSLPAAGAAPDSRAVNPG